ncbi:GNAT family N-acetyltransferase [Bifidobacterium tibiigranuli]|jgi:phosphinothricin acetyltransferase|uniref:GNAT family N-acetyltransferase n=1 Tax=Bifidobacterium tibiigranuli TaxID=2172043 RepID=UPI0026EBDDAE|nr:GNAT family N-acetyltransferase [Bifidobacterium tibiigranuli]MCI1649313.1 GNAT family N-acetyltransferase [Bifidobacterium tibiigranuli]MCI2184643.1 GNAT family N-acetyltransferase [Bifidobacterium tibiigranuli]MCI2204784.1 GNAT family N-acetyltransferase [Bifidobacterium tibiigranuli]
MSFASIAAATAEETQIETNLEADDSQPKQSEQERPSSITLRLARVEDARDIAQFYAHYVTETAINFEYDIPPKEEFAKRIELVSTRYPFIVADLNGSQVVGYAFAHPMGERPAYGWSADMSIYLDADFRGHRIGSALYQALEALLKAQHVVSLFSCITVRRDDSLADIGGLPPQLDDVAGDDSNGNGTAGTGNGVNSTVRTGIHDPHLPDTSPRFHAALGYKPVGRNYAAGYKLGTWYDKLWMEKPLRPLEAKPEPIVPITELSKELIAKALEDGTQLIRQRD